VLAGKDDTAKVRGMTLTDFIEHILEREVAHPLVSDVIERIASREPVMLGATAAELLRDERNTRKIS
jgi:hypothetical protein